MATCKHRLYLLLVVQVHAHLLLRMFGSGNCIHFWIVSLSKRCSQGSHLVRNLLHRICRSRCKSCRRVVPELLVFSVIACLLELHLEVVQKAIVSWTLRGGTPQSESTSSYIVHYELAVVRWLACKLNCAILEQVLQHLLFKLILATRSFPWSGFILFYYL